MMVLKTPYLKQKTIYSCGPAALSMHLGYFGILLTEDELLQKLQTDPDTGTKYTKIVETAQENGLLTYFTKKGTLEQIEFYIKKNLPVMVDYIEPIDGDGHYALVIGFDETHIILNDPWYGEKFSMKKERFLNSWNHKDHGQWMMILSKTTIPEYSAKI